MRFTHEIRVGVVVLVGLFLMVYGYVWLRGVGLGADLYYLRLNGVANIAEGNDVRLQGVKIGQVQTVTFDPDTQKPILTLAVRHGNPPIKLLTTYIFSIQSAGIIGENYVDIRGPYNPRDTVYPANDKSIVIVAKANGGLLAASDDADVAIKDFHQTLIRLNLTLDRINSGILNSNNEIKVATALDGLAKLTQNASEDFGPGGFKLGFGNAEAQANLNETLHNAALASQSAAEAAANIQQASASSVGLVADLRQVVGANKDEAHHLLFSLDQAATNVAGVTQTLDFALRQGGFKENAQIAFQSLRRAAENIEVATDGVRKLTQDQATVDDIHQTMDALRDSSQALRDTTKVVRDAVTDKTNANQISGSLTALATTAKNLQAVTEGLKNVIGDPQVQTELKGAAANLDGTLAATRSTAERLDSLLGGAKRHDPATGDATAAGGAAAPATAPASYQVPAVPSGLSFTYRHLFNEAGDPPVGTDHDFGDLAYNSEFFGGPFRLGLDNIGESNNLTLQSGRYLGKEADLRYGLYRSKLGTGLDLRRGKFSLEGNAWDPNHASYNVYGGMQLTPDLEILLGREDIAGEHANAVAVRITP